MARGSRPGMGLGGLIDFAIEAISTYVDVQNYKKSFTQMGVSVMNKMAGNPGQDALVNRYSELYPAYIDHICDNWDDHEWGYFLRKVTAGTSDSGVMGTMVILTTAFDVATAAVAAVQAAVAAAAANTVMEGMAGLMSRGRGMKGKTAKEIEAETRSFINAKTSWSRPGGIPSNWRHATNSKWLRDIKDSDDFYRRLDAPGIAGYRARFAAGATDQQLKLFMDINHQVKSPVSVVNIASGKRMTIIPSGHHWAGFAYGGKRNVAVHDPSGNLFRDAQAYHTRYLAAQAAQYKSPRAGGWYGDLNAGGPTPKGMVGYNPYRMQLQFQRGQFAGSKVWEGNSMPYGLDFG